MSGRTLLDTALATIDGVDGASAVTLPTVILSAEEAALLGEVDSWLSRERLIGKLWCRECGMEREMETAIEPHQIVLKCDHRMLFYQGPVPVQRVEHAEAVLPSALVRVTIPEMPMPAGDAYMQRKYGKFLKANGLMEALWCLRCEDEGQQSGLRVTVNAQEVSLLCRHRHLLYRGITI